MTIGSVTSTQLQALAVIKAVEDSAANQASGQIASSVVKAAAGVRVSGRTAQSLTDIVQASQVNLGYSKEERKSFTAMIDAARQYMNQIKQWAAQEAAAAVTTDPDKIAIDAHPSEELQAQQQKVAAYDKDFIAKMEKSLDQVMSDFFDHKLVFQTFSIGVTGNVNIMAKTFTTTDDGKLKTDSSFSFFQAQIEDKKKSPADDTIEYGTSWSVNDLTLFNTGPDRVL